MENLINTSNLFEINRLFTDLSKLGIKHDNLSHRVDELEEDLQSIWDSVNNKNNTNNTDKKEVKINGN